MANNRAFFLFLSIVQPGFSEEAIKPS